MRKPVLILFINILFCYILQSQSSFNLPHTSPGHLDKAGHLHDFDHIKSSTPGNVITYGDLATFSSQDSWLTDVTVLDSNRFVVVWTDHGNPNDAYAAVGFISGTNISYGPRIVMNSETTVWPRIAKLDSNRFIVSYAEYTGPTHGTRAVVRIGNINGSNITFGAEHMFQNDMFYSFYHRYPIETLGPNLFILSYVGYHANGNGVSRVGRIYGDSISLSDEHTYATITKIGSYGVGHPAMAILDSNKFAISYNGCDTAYYSASKVGTIIGDSVIYGPEYKFQEGAGERLTTITLDSTRFLSAYVDWLNEEKGTLVLGTKYGDSIEHSKEFIFYNGWTTWVSATTLDPWRFVVTCWDWENLIHHGTACAGEIIGDTIIFGPFNAYSPDYCFFPQAGTISDDRFLMVFAGVGYSYLGRSVIGTVTGNSFITLAGSANTCPGGVSSPVLIRNMENITEFSIILEYDTSGLEFNGIQHIHPLLQPDTLFFADSSGHLTLYWSSANPVSIEDDSLCQIEFIATSIGNQSKLNLVWDTLSYYVDTSGNAVNSHFINGYIEFDPIPDPLIYLSGQDTVCQGTQNVLYTIIPIQNADSIIWELSPPEAGLISGNGDSIYIDFAPDFNGEAYISGYGINDCGDGDQATYLTYVIGEPQAEAGLSAVICQDNTHTLSGSAVNYSVSVWHTEGDGSFDDPFLLDATYTPGPEDIHNGDVNLTLYCTAVSPCIGVANDYLELIIKRNPDKPHIPVGPTSIILGANLSDEYFTAPAEFSNAYQWYLNPIEAGTISGPDTAATVFWNQNYPGTTAHINVEAINDCTAISSDTLTVSVNPVGIIDHQLPEISVSPNPSSGIVNISISGISTELDVQILNNMGNVVHERKVNNKSSSHCFKLDLSNHTTGIYHLIVSREDQIMVEQFIIGSK